MKIYQVSNRRYRNDLVYYQFDNNECYQPVQYLLAQEISDTPYTNTMQYS